jgi:rare lipoprotein A
MQKSALTVLTLTLSFGLMSQANADMVQTQPLTIATESSNLANRVLDRDSQNASSTLFKPSATPSTLNNASALSTKAATVNALSITESTDSRVKTENVPARIDMVAKSNKSAVKATDDDGIINRLSNVASEAVRKFNQTGMASWYGRQFHGRKTASGDRFDMYAMTAAHRSLPLNCYIRVTNKNNGKSVVVKVNDRGPFHGNRVLDLSYAAASKLGITNSGTGNVTIERIAAPQ